ncbi:MAG: hypothetical protein BGP08_04400 [Rhizobiales bacterium 64-17]|nr:MAG: hypothetical protein BGP08_04400 [Rhizobiales bacterium 64-17]
MAILWMMRDEATPKRARQAGRGMTQEPINIRAFGRALGAQTGGGANAVRRRMGIAGVTHRKSPE